MNLKWIYFFVIFFPLLGCQPDIEFTTDNLFGVSEINYKINIDTIEIEYLDKSRIFFEDYNALKSNVLVHDNLEELKKFKFAKTVGITEKKVFTFLKDYQEEDLNFIDSIYTNNSDFRKIAIQITSTMNVTDWWNFKNAFEFTNEKIDSIGEDPISLLYEFSLESKDSIQTSRSYKRLQLIGEMINETGITDTYSQKRISSKEFMNKFNYFFEVKGLRKIE